MDDRKISEHESLALINQMISKAKNEINDNGLGWLVWGSMIIFASLSTYFILVFDLNVNLYLGWNIFGLV